MDDSYNEISVVTDSIHELAGLLHLAGREDCPMIVADLIRRRVDDIHARCHAIADGIMAVSPEEPLTPELPEETLTPELPQEPRTPGPGFIHPDKDRHAVKVFTLNDRYLYTRELFGNRRDEFDSAMLALAGMDSYEEAEDYFLYRLGWDAENPHVRKFMLTASRLF